jgi:hypothetical protein
MVSHEFRHWFFTLPIGLLILSLVLDLHINECWLKLSRFDSWSCSPILVSLIVGCCSYETGISHLWIKCILSWLNFRLYFEWLVNVFVSGSEISGNIIGYFHLKSFHVKVEYLSFSIRVILTILIYIIRLHLLWILVLQQLILSFKTFTTWNATIILTFEILLKIGFEEFGFWEFVESRCGSFKVVIRIFIFSRKHRFCVMLYCP